MGKTRLMLFLDERKNIECSGFFEYDDEYEIKILESSCVNEIFFWQRHLLQPIGCPAIISRQLVNLKFQTKLGNELEFE